MRSWRSWKDDDLSQGRFKRKIVILSEPEKRVAKDPGSWSHWEGRSERCGRMTGTGKSKVILGVDPGLARMGFGALLQQGNRMRALDYGTLTTPAGGAAEGRLTDIFQQLQAVLRRVKPSVVAMEELYFARNAKTAVAVGQARGVALLACGLARVPVFGYKPLEIKQAVAGHGSADKGQVQRMVKALLGLAEVPKPDDTADALAVAITHAQCSATALSEKVKGLAKRPPLSAGEAWRGAKVKKMF
jgi:crossover junction endodeoxyribonuclease RuvC